MKGAGASIEEDYFWAIGADYGGFKVGAESREGGIMLHQANVVREYTMFEW